MKYLRPMNTLDLLQDDFDDFFKPEFRPHHPMMPENAMRTDIKEDGENLVLDIEVPGYKKEDINIEYDEGYLTVTAKNVQEKETKEDKKEKFIRKERFTGCISRKFYIGEINEKDISAKYENGVLVLSFPKESKKIETKKTITIA